MRRGLTLIELLLALALLTGIAAATLPLTRSMLSGAREIDKELLWQRSAEMTLGEIDRLLLRHGRHIDSSEAVQIKDNRLTIRLTGGSAVMISVTDDELRTHTGAKPSRVLVGRITEASFTIDESTETLTIELRSLDGETARRSWELSP